MWTILLVAPLLTLGGPVDQQPEFWPWDTVLEWEFNYWEWLGEEEGKTDKIPKNARMITGLRLYEKLGREGYARTDVGEDATFRVALIPK
jgi:hypothetical protein